MIGMERYPRLVKLYFLVADMTKEVEKAEEKSGSAGYIFADDYKLVTSAPRYSRVLLHITVHLLGNSEWVGELEEKLGDSENPDQQIAIVEKFLFEKASAMEAATLEPSDWQAIESAGWTRYKHGSIALEFVLRFKTNGNRMEDNIDYVVDRVRERTNHLFKQMFLPYEIVILRPRYKERSGIWTLKRMR